MITISIITTTYNSAATIEDTLQSVARQSYKAIEHIIIDGMSKDHTLSKVQNYPHVAKVISESDNGIYDAMNKGLSMASGEVIGILNSDDYYIDNEIITEIAQLFLQEDDLECVYGDLLYVDQTNTSKILRKWKSGNYHKSAFLNGWMPPHPTFFVRRRVYEKYGNFNVNLGTAADYELMLRFLYKYNCRCAYLPKYFIKMRAGGASNQSLKARWNANKQDRLAWSINGLQPRFYTLICKPLRKIIQFIQ